MPSAAPALVVTKPSFSLAALSQPKPTPAVVMETAGMSATTVSAAPQDEAAQLKERFDAWKAKKAYVCRVAFIDLRIDASHVFHLPCVRSLGRLSAERKPVAFAVKPAGVPATNVPVMVETAPVAPITPRAIPPAVFSSGTPTISFTVPPVVVATKAAPVTPGRVNQIDMSLRAIESYVEVFITSLPETILWFCCVCVCVRVCVCISS
jgi:hypothetical protein